MDIVGTRPPLALDINYSVGHTGCAVRPVSPSLDHCHNFAKRTISSVLEREEGRVRGRESGAERGVYRLFWHCCKVVSIKLLLAFVIIALNGAASPPSTPGSTPLLWHCCLSATSLSFTLSLSLPVTLSRCSSILICLTSVFAAKMMNCFISGD